MSSVDQAYETQLKNIQIKTGKTLDRLYAMIQKSGLTKHGEIRELLKRDLGLGHGDANTLTHYYLKSLETQSGQAATPGDVLAEIYSAPKPNCGPFTTNCWRQSRNLARLRSPRRKTASACDARNNLP